MDEQLEQEIRELVLSMFCVSEVSGQMFAEHNFGQNEETGNYYCRRCFKSK